ncbi:MAG: hypothetical protein ACTHM6_02470 [Tepidisphaeraceae bacterium]
MGASFYRNSKDAELVIASDVFSTVINESAAAYGLTAAMAAAYGAINDNFKSAVSVAENPATRTSGNIAARNAARAELRRMAANLCNIINSTPTVTDKMKLDAGVSGRAKPSERGAPGAAYAFKVGLEPTGALGFAWKCKNPPGVSSTTYNVFRRTAQDQEATFLGTTGTRKFVDATLPAGSSSVTYQVQGIRSTVAGPWAQVTVNIGTGGQNGVMSITESPIKKAA